MQPLYLPAFPQKLCGQQNTAVCNTTNEATYTSRYRNDLVLYSTAIPSTTYIGDINISVTVYREPSHLNSCIYIYIYIYLLYTENLTYYNIDYRLGSLYTVIYKFRSPMHSLISINFDQMFLKTECMPHVIMCIPLLLFNVTVAIINKAVFNSSIAVANL